MNGKTCCAEQCLIYCLLVAHLQEFSCDPCFALSDFAGLIFSFTNSLRPLLILLPIPTKQLRLLWDP